MKKSLFCRFWIRFLHYFARNVYPNKLRIFLHRARGVKIEKDCFIGFGVHIDDYCPEAILIERGGDIGAYSILLAHQPDFDNFLMTKNRDRKMIVKPITIKRESFLGTRVIVLPGVIIGEKSIIGAGSVVKSSIADRVVACGCPAIVKRSIV